MQAQMDQVQKFINELVDKRFAGETGITDEVKKELQQDALERMNTFIFEATLDELSDDDVKTFQTMIEEKKSPDELQQFIQTHITDYPGFMKDVLEEFQQIYLTGRQTYATNP